VVPKGVVAAIEGGDVVLFDKRLGKVVDIHRGDARPNVGGQSSLSMLDSISDLPKATHFPSLWQQIISYALTSTLKFTFQYLLLWVILFNLYKFVTANGIET